MADLWENLAPHRNTFLMNTPGEVSENLSMPKPVIATISNWISSKKINDNSEKRQRFNQIPKLA